MHVDISGHMPHNIRDILCLLHHKIHNHCLLLFHLFNKEMEGLPDGERNSSAGEGSLPQRSEPRVHYNTFNAEKDVMSRGREAFRLQLSEVSMLRMAYWKEKRGIQATSEAFYNKFQIHQDPKHDPEVERLQKQPHKSYA